MARLKIGVVTECLRLGLRRGMRKAADLGMAGIQVRVTHGELAPENLSQSARRDFLAQARSCRLEVSAVCGDFGKGFGELASVDEVVGRTKRIIDLAVGLRVPTVTTYLGKVVDDENDPRRSLMAEAATEVGRHAENYECFLAAETGSEDPRALLQFIESLDTEGIKVNYDPANLVMNGFDPVAGVFALGSHVVHVHAKDGVRHADGSREEMALGEGGIDWLAYVAALDAVGFKGFYTIERERSGDPVGDIARAKEFLERF